MFYLNYVRVCKNNVQPASLIQTPVVLVDDFNKILLIEINHFLH